MATVNDPNQSPAETRRLQAQAGQTPAAPATKSAGAPSKADAARKKTITTGLADALNKFQAEISGPGTDTPQLYPDKYTIVIVDDVLQNAKIVPPGQTNLKQTPMTQAETANQQKNPATQKVDNNAKSSKIIAGRSIVQVLDELVRTSTYIYDQQIFQRDPKTGELRPNGSPAETVGWYRIGLQAVPQLDKFDTKRNDYAYDITYQINIYAVSDVKTDYFSPPNFRGVQKIYNYWFSGENTQILDFSQDFNYLYYIVSNGPRQPDNRTSDTREIERRYYQVNSPQSSQGQDDDKVNEPSANAADYLYSPGDQARVKLKIVGDPAWIFQGETWAGIAGQNLLYDAFLPDGTINPEAQQVLFRLQWNNPVDYDLDTGIMDPTTKNVNRTGTNAGEPQQSFVYQAIECMSHFSRGKFEQELVGVLQTYPIPQKNKIEAERESAAAFEDRPASAFASGPNQSDAETRRLQAASNQARFGAKTWSDRQQQAATTMRNARREQLVNSGPLTSDSLAAEGFVTAAPDESPTSGGQVVGPASTPTSLFGVYGGATGQNTGNPVVTFTTQRGRVVTASSDQDIKDAFNAGFINRPVANELTRQLNALQQQANSPVTAAPRQITRRET